MPQASDTFLAELGLKRFEHAVHPRSDDPGSEIWRAHLTHPVLCRMLESAETPAPFLRLDTAVVFAMLRHLVIEESERSPFGLAAIEQGAESGREPASLGSMSLGELPTEAAKLTDARQGPPRAPKWALALDAEQENDGWLNAEIAHGPPRWRTMEGICTSR